VPHVGYVHHMVHLVAVSPERADENVVQDVGAKVTDVGVVVNGWAASVKADLTRPQRFENLRFTAKGVEKGERGIHTYPTGYAKWPEKARLNLFTGAVSMYNTLNEAGAA